LKNISSTMPKENEGFPPLADQVSARSTQFTHNSCCSAYYNIPEGGSFLRG